MDKLILVFIGEKMADISVYVVVNLTINDADEYRIYEKGFFPILKKHNGTFITYDDSPEVLEGPKPLPGRAIIFSFPKGTSTISPGVNFSFFVLYVNEKLNILGSNTCAFIF